MTKPKWLTCPDDLGEHARRYWNHYANGLRAAGHLTPESLESFRFLTQLLATAQAAAEAIERDGAVIRGSSGAVRANPACGIQIAAQREAAKLLRSFGLES